MSDGWNLRVPFIINRKKQHSNFLTELHVAICTAFLGSLQTAALPTALGTKLQIPLKGYCNRRAECTSTATICSISLKKTPWSESASELCRPSDRRLSAKRLPTCADRGCHVASVADPSGRISRFSRQEPLLFYQVASQLYSRGWVDPVPDPLLFFFFW
jgi:hypothetical protein